MSARAPAKKRKRILVRSIHNQRGGPIAPNIYSSEPSLGFSSVEITPVYQSSDSPPPSSAPPSSETSAPPSSERGILILGKQVGAGAFGSVVNSIYYDPNDAKSRIMNYVGQPLQPRRHYAVKIQNKSETKKEMDILRKIGESPYIIKVYGRGDIPGETNMDAMVSDMYTQTLSDRTQKERIETRRRNFPDLTKQMFEAVAVLASKNIVHRDLHAGNIMFGSNPYGEPKIIDFGWSMEAPPNGRFNPFPYMPDSEPYRIYHPPEQRMFLNGTYKYGICTSKFDVYSMAMDLIELVYDSSKTRINNWTSFPKDFRMLMTCAILRIPIEGCESAYAPYSTFDKLDRECRKEGVRFYPDAANMADIVLIKSQTLDNICSYFEERDTDIRLVLSMPTQLGKVLHDCLQFEATRPTAAEVLQRLGSPGLIMSSSLRF